MAVADSRVVAKELRERSDGELRSLLSAKTEELHKAKFKQALGQLSETHILKVLRKDVARLQTVLNQRREQ